MSGIYVGVHFLKVDHKYCIYIHCMSRRLNLALVEGLRLVNLQIMQMILFAIIQSLYIIFSNPAYNFKYKSLCNMLEIEPLPIPQHSDTRWSCRYFSVKAIEQNYIIIINTLEQLTQIRSKESESTIKFQAIGILMQIQKQEFKISLKFFLE